MVLMIITRIFLKYKNQEIVFKHFVAWILFWLATIIIIIFPDLTVAPANWLGIGRGADLVVYLSLIFIFYLLFRFLLRLEKMEKEITMLVRENALNDYERRNKK